MPDTTAETAVVGATVNPDTGDTAGEARLSALMERGGPPAAVGRWAELVSTALVGTDRRALSSAQPDGEDSQDPALTLLSLAAVAGLVHRVGGPPPRFDGALPRPAPADPRPPLPDPAARRLRAILDSYPKYLPQWLAAVRRAGYRLPAGFSPALLDLGRTNTLIRADLAVVLGAPGRWLAKASGNWKYILREARETLDEADWQGPDQDSRLAYVAGLYLVGPDAARRLIRQAWPQERVPVKMGLLALMSRHADPADLPFVESLIKDDSKQVRGEATLLAGSLQRRPGRPVPDFTAEIRRLLSVHRGIGRDLHNFVMSRSDEDWPEDGSVLLLDALAAHGERRDEPGWSSWIAEQVQTAVGDHAPVSVRDRVARLVADQALAAAAGEPPGADFGPVLVLLDFRRDMLAELSVP